MTWRVCRATKDLLGVDGASITVASNTPERVTLCATDERSGELENLQDPLSSLTPGDERDWGSRARVHQATGMLVGQLGVSPNDALALLRAHSFAEGARLADVARDVLERRVNLPGL